MATFQCLSTKTAQQKNFCVVELSKLYRMTFESWQSVVWNQFVPTLLRGAFFDTWKRLPLNGCHGAHGRLRFIQQKRSDSRRDALSSRLCLESQKWSMTELQPVDSVGCKWEKIKHWNVATYGLPGSAWLYCTWTAGLTAGTNCFKVIITVMLYCRWTIHSSGMKV